MGMDYLQSDRAYKSEIIRQQQYTVSAGYYVPVLSDRRSCVILSLGASALLGYEVANGGRRELIDGATLLNRNGFLYGGAVGLEIEAFASDRVALTAELRERIAGGSSFGACHTVIGIGIKFLIP